MHRKPILRPPPYHAHLSSGTRNDDGSFNPRCSGLRYRSGRARDADGLGLPRRPAALCQQPCQPGARPAALRRVRVRVCLAGCSLRLESHRRWIPTRRIEVQSSVEAYLHTYDFYPHEIAALARSRRSRRPRGSRRRWRRSWMTCECVDRRHLGLTFPRCSLRAPLDALTE